MISENPPFLSSLSEHYKIITDAVPPANIEFQQSIIEQPQCTLNLPNIQNQRIQSIEQRQFTENLQDQHNQEKQLIEKSMDDVHLHAKSKEVKISTSRRFFLQINQYLLFMFYTLIFIVFKK